MYDRDGHYSLGGNSGELVFKEATNTHMIGDSIEIDKDCKHGKPCLKGHRITVAQILSELNDGQSPRELEKDLDLKPGLISNMMEDLAKHFDRCWAVNNVCNKSN